MHRLGWTRGRLCSASGRRGLSTVVPHPRPNPDTQGFWDGCNRHELRLQRCDGCEAFRFYPSPLCPSCGAADHQWRRVEGTGEVYSYVVVRRAMSGAFAHEVPYVVALVELDETGGIRLPARVADCRVEDVSIGMAVEVRFDAVGDDITLPVFAPISQD